MKSAVHWLAFSLSVVLGVIMMFCGVLFIRNMYVCFYMSGGQSIFCSLLLGVLLLMTGGGLLSSTFVGLAKGGPGKPPL